VQKSALRSQDPNPPSDYRMQSNTPFLGRAMNVPLRSSMTPANTYVPNAQQSVQQYSALYQVCLRRTVCAEINLSPPPLHHNPSLDGPPPAYQITLPHVAALHHAARHIALLHHALTRGTKQNQAETQRLQSQVHPCLIKCPCSVWQLLPRDITWRDRVYTCACACAHM